MASTLKRAFAFAKPTDQPSVISILFFLVTLVHFLWNAITLPHRVLARPDEALILSQKIYQKMGAAQ